MDTYFRWWGVYTQGDAAGAVGGIGGEGRAVRFFMVRIRIPNGFLSSVQLRMIAGLAERYGLGVADITVRQNIQLHWVTIQALPEVLDSLIRCGLSSLGTCGDVARNITGCPLAGVDADEICDASRLVEQASHLLAGQLRLRVGSIRWKDFEENHGTAAMRTCLLHVPVHKTGTAFVKPVDSIVGREIEAWEKARPEQPLLLDVKTGELVHFLFVYRTRQVSDRYLNHTIIPALCKKAGIPREDARGAITCHRARATIASQLYNAREPLSLFELQEWMGHRSPQSTQSYAKISPTKLAKSYNAAGYFERNLRTIEVLVDQQAIRKGLASGTPWKYYDLGHGYCTYDFFDQCPHRMACAKCSFYQPKDSTASTLLEGKNNLLRMRQEIPLGESEIAALDDGVSALESLLGRLANVPTPAGPSPLELRGESLVQIQQARSDD